MSDTKMNKSKLTKKLKVITERYKEIPPLHSDDTAIHDFANCLNNPDLAAHLLETEICPDEEELEEFLPQYKTAEAIINSYQEMYDNLESMGLVKKIEQPECKMIDEPNLEQNALDIMISETFSKLVNLSQTMPPLDSQEDIKSGLSTCLFDTCKALDDDRIHFDKQDDKAVFHGLMTIALMVVFDGKVPATQVEGATVQ